jgi:hypothetical protein
MHALFPIRANAATATPISAHWQCSALAYGDFLIDCNFMRLAGPGHQLLAASYLRPLAEAISYDGPVRYFDMSPKDVPPSVFNARKANVRAILGSLRQLRTGLLRSTSADDIITVPHNDIRWRLACLPRRINVLRERHENIYLAYCTRFGLEPEKLIIPTPSRLNEVLVFPDSRQPAKQIPESTLQSVADINSRAGIATRIVRVRPPDPGRVDAPGEISLWGLPALVDAVNRAQAIVSADSLPGHLAEYLQRPAFILIRQINEPLMPLSVLLRQRWGRFDVLGSYQHWIDDIGNA